MADRVLRWFVPGDISRIRTQVGGTHKLDKDYTPVRVHLSCRVAPRGDRPIKVDILDDDVSIFTDKPALDAQSDVEWDTISGDLMEEDSIIKLNIDQVADVANGEDLTVELELEEA